MKTLFLCGVLTSLSLCSAREARASLARPETAAGKKLVHQLAEEASRTFVQQTDNASPEEALESCEASRSALLERFQGLEVSKSRDLLAAKTALEKTTCPTNTGSDKGMGPASASSDVQQALTHFFTATVYLRAADNND